MTHARRQTKARAWYESRIDRLLAQLAEAQKGARQRTVSPADASAWLARLSLAVIDAEARGGTVAARMDGGAVPGAYRYQADTTVLGYREEDNAVACERRRADTVPHGRPGRSYVQRTTEQEGLTGEGRQIRKGAPWYVQQY